MKTVGTFEVKTHLSTLLEQVERGNHDHQARQGGGRPRAAARGRSRPAGGYGGAAEGLPARTPAGRSLCQGAGRGRAAVMQVKVVVHEAEEGGFWAEVPALPGCVSQGETMDELLANILEAIQAWLATEPPS